MTTKRDVLIVGAGINGLAAAAILARSGCRVIVLEAADTIGGAARSFEFAPGLRAPLAAHLLPVVTTGPLRQLPLAQFGWRETAKPVESTALLPGRDSLDIDTPTNNTLDADVIAGWQRFAAEVDKNGALLRHSLERAPLTLLPTSWTERRQWLRTGVSLFGHGPRRIREVLRVVAMSVTDYVSEFVDDPAIAGVLCQEGLWGSSFGPRAPGTMLGLLYRRALLGRAGRWQQGAGRTQLLLNAIADCARDGGAEIRTAVRAKRILVESGKATGVELTSGEVLRALTVVSALDPQATLLQLIGPRALEAGHSRAARQIRRRAYCARVFLAVSALPSFITPDRAARARVVIAAPPDAIEAAADASHDGAVHEEVQLEITVPSAVDSTLAPDGTYVLSISVQFSPESRDSEQALLAATIARLAEHDPALPAKVVASACLSPQTLGDELGSDRAHWHHTDLTMDQFLFTRPFALAPRYRLPVDGLFLASAGVHPGGGLTGWPGCLAAAELLRS
ncbi:MAG: NAD(P)/FAD-dependent oxidoreductase [Pseudomonadota bacterium]